MQIRCLPFCAAVVVFAAAFGSAVAAAAGDPEAGKAQSLVCAACHGQDGAPPAGTRRPPLTPRSRSCFSRL